MAKQILKSVVIALGGTGQKVIIELKKRLLQRYGEIPEVIRFLSIDADIIKERDDNFYYDYLKDTKKAQVKIDASEEIYLEPGNFLTFQRKQQNFKEFLHENFTDYAPEAATGDGANAKRIVGKMLVAKNYKTVNDKILDAFHEISHDETITKVQDKGYQLGNEKPIFCFIVGSWVGGTGSGTFIDVANIIKSYDVHIKTIGFFAMPCYFSAFAFQSNARSNTYGAFTEIDFLQNPSIFANRNKNIPTFEGKYIEQMRYNLIYLMQQRRSNKTNITKETMEAATALAISNMLSAIGDSVYSAISNNQQFSITMGGKHRGYTGFGVCEIVLKRSELKNYIKDKLIFKYLHQYNSNNINVDEVRLNIDKFIKDNKLDEGVSEEASKINQIIDELYTLNNKELNLLFQPIDYSSHAEDDLKKAKIDFEQKLNQRASTLIVNYKISDKIELIRTTIRQMLYTKGGISRASHFTRSLSNQFEEMKKWLSIEIKQHHKKLEEQEEKLNDIISEIHKKSTGIGSLFNKGKVNQLIENYSYIVANETDRNNIRNLLLEIKRKEKAIDVYIDLIKICSEYYKEIGDETKGEIPILSKNVNETIDKLSLRIRQYQPELSDDIRVFINYYFKQIIDNEQHFGELTSDININISEFLQNNSTNDLIDKLNSFIDNSVSLGSDSILSKLYNSEYTVENLLIDFGDYTIKQGNEKIGLTDISLKEAIINILRDKLALIWQYNEMDLQTDAKTTKYPEKIFVIGNFTGEVQFVTNEIITNLKIKNLRFAGETRVATNDIDRLTFHIQEDAIPAFKLWGIEEYRKEFFNAKSVKTNYFFTDKRIELAAPDIFPQEDEEEILKYWTIGIFEGYIFNERRGYYIRSSKGSLSTSVQLFEGISGKNDRKLAFEYFMQNSGFKEEMEKRYNEMFERDKPSLIKDLLKYFHEGIYHRDNLGKVFKSTEEQEKQLLLKEKRKLVEIGIYDLKMKDTEFIDEKIKTAGGKKYEQHIHDLQSLGLDVHL